MIYHSSATERSSSRTLLFAGRTTKEILRDPLSFVFCLALPVLMLIFMYVLFCEQAPWFGLPILTPGIAVFSNAFIMLHMTLLCSRDRESAFLTRLYTSPMRTVDFVAGYALPGMIIGTCQIVVCYLTAIITGFLTGSTDWIHQGRILCAVAVALPMMVTYVFVGILFGCLFSAQAAPGLCSIIISASGFLSGAWMPVETMADGFVIFCRTLPFYPAVIAGRAALNGHSFDSAFWISLATTIVYALILGLATVLIFRYKTRREGE